MRYQTFTVAKRGNSLLGEYAPKHVTGYEAYTIWRVKVAWDIDNYGNYGTPEAVSVELLDVNVYNPTKKAVNNGYLLEANGVI